MNTLRLLIFLLLSPIARSQDSLSTLTYQQFIEIVMEHHPYAHRAEIVQSMGNATVTEARGAFDPKLFGKMDQKYFGDQQYYSHLHSGLKVPTWFGLSAEGGYDLNDGVYLNPEQRLPNNGLWYAGLRLELGNGLIIDERRASLSKAKLARTISTHERTILLNELRRDASLAYFKWQQSYKKANIYRLAYDNAIIRWDAVKNAVIFGDRPYIDTVEAALNAQNRLLSLQSAENELRNAQLKMEVYLWSEGFIPLELNGALPELENVDLSSSLFDMDSVLLGHPYLAINDLEYKQRTIDLALKKEQLKPDISLKYNAISEPVGGNLFAEYSPSNYTWGATFEYPILTRKERAGVRLAQLKLQDQGLKNKTALAEILYTIQATRNNVSTALEQLQTATDLVENNRRLYDAEKELFNLGESSLFMINSRENQWLKSNLQLIDIENQVSQLQAELSYWLMDY